jgi:hypothetical protein
VPELIVDHACEIRLHLRQQESVAVPRQAERDRDHRDAGQHQAQERGPHRGPVPDGL